GAGYAPRVSASVGRARGAGASDLELLRASERPVLASSGAQIKMMAAIAVAPLTPLTPETAEGMYVRRTDRAAPHNLYLRAGRLRPEEPGRDALTTGFRYGPPPRGGEPERTRTVSYPAARFTFTWSGARDRWLVTMDGTPATTAQGQPIAPATVVVQYVTVRPSDYHDFLGNNTPYTETVGSGRATVLRDGRAYDVGWNRPEAEDGTRFTTDDGTPVDFARGQVWVVYAEAP